MKRKLTYLIPIFFIVFCYCKYSTEQDETASNVSYTSYDGYSYKGEKSLSDTTFFYYTTTKEDFDSLFFFIYDHNPAPRIPEKEFLANRVISIVKYGNDYYELEVENMNILNGTLHIKYKAILEAENMSWTAAIPIIVTVDTVFEQICFYENNEKIYEIII